MTKRLLAVGGVAMMAALPMTTAHADPAARVTEGSIARQAENTPPTSNWVMYTRDGGNGSFVEGPATAPLGRGSLQLSTPTGADKVQLFNYDHVGTALSAIDAIGYSTYRSAGSLQQDAALNLEIDSNGPEVAGGYSTLVFEPVYNTDQGVVVDNTWQTWDAYNGGEATWWSTKTISGACAFTCYVSWADIVAANPDATILGAFGVNQGSGNPGLVTAVDALQLGVNGNTTTYNFEPSTDQCKNGGYKTFSDPSFRNQGACVSYFASGQ